MARRFIQFGPTPISSGVQELPLEILYKKGQDIQKEQDLLANYALQTFNPVKPGYATEEQAKYVNQKIQDLSSNITDTLLDPNQGGVDAFKSALLNANKQITSDPNYLSVQQDYKFRPEFEKLHKENVEKYNIPLYIDKGKVKQAGINEIVNPATYYSRVPFVDINKQFNEALSKITPQLTEWAGEDISGVTQNSQGDYFAVTKSGKIKQLDENVKHVKQALESIPYEILNNPANRTYFEEGTKRGIIPDYAPSGDLVNKASAYMQTLFPKYRQYENVSKVGYDKLGNTFDNAAKRAEAVPTVLPFDSQLLSGSTDYGQFETTAKTASDARNSSWVSLRDNLASSALYIPGINIKNQTRGVLLDDDVQKVIDYANTNPTNLSIEQRAKLDNLKQQAISYQANKGQLDFYKSQLLSKLGDAEAKAKADFKKRYPNATWDPDYSKEIATLKKNINNGDFSLNSITEATPGGDYISKAGSVGNQLKTLMEDSGTLGLSNAYILINSKTGDYSPVSKAVANTVSNRAMSGGILYEGMNASNNSVEEIEDLFEKKTGHKPEGKLEAVGSAVDANGRTGIIYEDKKTGRVATFIVPNKLEYAPILKDTYKSIAKSGDPFAESVAKQGYFDTELIEFGQKIKFDNFSKATYPTTFDFGNTEISNNGKGIFSFKNPSDGRDLVFTTIQDLKEALGRIRIN